MSESFGQTSEYGIKTSGFPEVDRRVAEIVSPDDTQFASRQIRKEAFGQDIFIGDSIYEHGEAPFSQKVVIDPQGALSQLVLTQPNTSDVPTGYTQKVAALFEDMFMSRPPESFPAIAGWQMMLNWSYFGSDAYRAQRAESLYGTFNSVDLRDKLRADPLVVISPIMPGSIRPGAPLVANETYAMFGRYNGGDIVPAIPDLDQYEYMAKYSFEDPAFMHQLTAGFLPR